MTRNLFHPLALLLLISTFASAALQIRNLRIEPEFLCPGQEVTVYFESVHDYGMYAYFAGALSINNGAWDNDDYLFLYQGGQGAVAQNPPISATVYTTLPPGFDQTYVGWREYAWKTRIPSSFPQGQMATIIVKASQQLSYAASMSVSAQESITVEINCNKGAVYNTARMGEKEAVGKLILVSLPPDALLEAVPGDTTYDKASLAVTLTTNAGNVIYWTTDPTLDPAVDTLDPGVHKINSHTGVVTITGTVTLKAHAMGAGYTAVSRQWRYTQNLPRALLTATPGDTTYRSASLAVQLTSNPGNVIYWTTDATVNLAVDTTNPAVQKITSSGTVTITGSATLFARATGADFLPADSSWTYICKIPQLVRLELTPDSGRIAAGDSLIFTARVVDDTGGIRAEFNGSIAWTLTPAGSRSSLAGTTGGNNTFYGIDAHQTYTVKASFTNPDNPSSLLTDSARVVVIPGAEHRTVIEADTLAALNRAEPLDSVYIGPAMMADTVYAIVRDRFDNFCRLASHAEWRCRNPAIAAAQPASGRPYAGVISRSGAGSTEVIAREITGSALQPDTVRVIVAAGEITALRLINAANGRVIDSIVMKTDQEITLKLQGCYSFAPATWVEVAGSWSLNPNSLTLNSPLPTDPVTSWKLSPSSAGRTDLTAAADSRAVSVPVTVRPVIRILESAVCDNPFIPGTSQIPASQRGSGDPVSGTRIEVRFSAPVVDNTGNGLMTGVITIYDAVGNCIVQHQPLRPDGAKLYWIWDGRNRGGAWVSSGSYLGKIEVVDVIDKHATFVKTLIAVKGSASAGNAR